MQLSPLPAFVRCRRCAPAPDATRCLVEPVAAATVHVADGATAAYNIPMTHWRWRGSVGSEGVVSASLVASSVASVADRHVVLRHERWRRVRPTALRSACTLGWWMVGGVVHLRQQDNQRALRACVLR